MPLTLGRMSAQWLVLAAVLLTTLIGAALAAALAVFAGQTVPQAAQRNLAAAPGTSVLFSGPLPPGQAGPVTTALHAAMRSAFEAVPFAFYRALWSGPLTLTGPAGLPQRPLMKAAAAGAIEVNSVLESGHWPTAPRPGQPIPAALPAATARLLHLSAGESLVLRDHAVGPPVRMRLTGTFRPRDPASPYWQVNLIGAAGFRSAGRHTTYGPLVVSPAAFRGALAISAGSWVIEPDLSDIRDGQLGPLAARIVQEQQLIPESVTLGYLHTSTNLPAVLGGMASNLVVAHSLLTIGGLQLLLLVAAALVLAARLLASQRRAEAALLSARGGTRWQLTRLNVTEALLLAAIATVVGGLAGWWLAGLLARAGPLHAAGMRISAAAPGTWWAAAAAALVCAAIMLGSSLRPVSPGAARARRGRPAVVVGLALAGADVALVLLATVAVWQLRRYSAVAPAAGGTLGVDPVLVAAPVLALGGATIVLVRLLPAAAKAGDRLAARGRSLAAALASWQISRRPVRQAGAALLMIMAVATGTFALCQHQSWVRSARDQAAFDAGADVRVDTPLPVSAAQAGAIAAAPGVRDAMPAARLGYGSVGQAMALDASKAAGTVLLRPDLAPLPATALFRRITPGGGAPGRYIPGHPARVEVAASLGPASLRLGTAVASLSVQDADGNVYALPAGTLTADGRVHSLAAEITPSRRAVYPLRLLAITLDYRLPRTHRRPTVQLTLHSIAASPAPAGPFAAPFARGAALSGWTPTAASPGQLTLTAGMPPVLAIPGIATRSYLRSASATVGSTVQISADGVPIPVKIAAAVTAFPTISGAGGGVVVDLAAVQDALTARSLPPVPVSEWWLATTTARPPAGLTASLPSGSAITAPGPLAAGLLGDPLSAAPQQALLAIALAAAVLAIAGFSVSIAASVSERRSQSALLSALGVSRAAQAGQLCVEELMLSLPSAAAGLALGAGLSWLLVPAVTLTTGAVAPVPAALTEFAWSRAIPLAIAVATIPVLVAAATVAHRPDPAAELRAAEAT
jgi:hypothetical protein